MLSAVGSLGKKSKLEPIPSPDLQLNFDQASIGANAAPNDAIDFSRASNATFTDADGLVKYAPHNFQTYSEEIDNSAYMKTRLSVSVNATTAPNGTTTADKIVEDNTNGSRYYREHFNVVSGQFYTWSGHFKASERNFVVLWSAFGSGLLPVVFTTFNLTTGTIHYNDNDQETATITDEGNGWFRCSITVQATGTGVEDVGVMLWDGNGSVTDADNSGFVYTGDGSSGIFAWGMQFSNHKFVPIGNPYIKTTSAAVYSARLEHEPGYFLSADQAQNLILDSETIVSSNSGWLTTAATANSTDVPSGIGADNSTQITFSANAQVYNLVNNIVAGETYTFSYYVKLGTKSNNKYAVYDDTANAFIVSIAINTSASSSEWTRFSLTVTAPANCNQLRFYVDRADNSGEYGTTFITGVQVEVGSTATTYNQTNGLEYYGGGATQNGLLIEEQRVNKLVRSEELDNAAWNKSSIVTVTANQILSPNGSVNANEVKVTGTPSSNTHLVQDAINVNSGETYTFSCFLKKGQQRYAVLGFETAVNPQVKGGVDLENGNIITGSDSSTQVEDYGNGWFRCTITATTTATSGMNCNIFLNDADDVTVIHTPTANDSIYVWGAQVEQGAFATSYIPTSGSTVTRSADLATMGPVTGTNLILQSEDLSTTWTTTNATVTANDTTAPDGLTTADKLVENSGTGEKLVLQAISGLASNVVYTFSVYARAAERGKVRIRIDDIGSDYFGADINFANDEISQTFGINNGVFIDASFEEVGNEWYRLKVSGIPSPSGTGVRAIIYLMQSTGATGYTGDGSSGMHLWGFQLEQAPTLITDAEDFSAWSASGLTITTDNLEAPDGNTTADKLVTSSTGIASKTITKANEVKTFTASIYAKSSGEDAFVLTLDDGATTNRGRAVFNLTNGTLTSSENNGDFTNTTASIQDVGNNWYRLILTTTTNNSTSVRHRVFFFDDGSNPVYLWGAQVEEGLSATPYPPEPTKYLPTYASTDLPFVGYNQNQGTIHTRFTMLGLKDFKRIYQLSKNNTDDAIQILTFVSGNGVFESIKDDGTDTMFANYARVLGGESMNHVLGYKENDVRVERKNGLGLVDSHSEGSVIIPDEVDRLGLGVKVDSSNQVGSLIMKRFYYHASRLKNDFLKRLI